MKTTPFFLATAISTVLQGILILVTAGVAYFAVTTAFDQSSNLQPGDYTFLYGLGGLSCLSCIFLPIIYLGTGWLYTYLHWREATLSLEIGALGGGLSSALAGLITGIFSGLVSIVLMPLIYQNAFPGQLNPGYDLPFQSINTLTTSFSSLFSACWSALIAGALGAVGGLIGAALYSNRSRL